MNIYNKIRCKFTVASVVPLLAGLLIYILLREGTFIHSVLPDTVNSIAQKVCAKTGICPFLNFLRYYFADFLWSFSLNFAMFTVIDLKKRWFFVAMSSISAFTGVLFEVAQLAGLTAGTFDVVDIIMYIIASASALAISIKILKRID